MAEASLRVAAQRLKMSCTVLVVLLFAIVVAEIAARAGTSAEGAAYNRFGLDLLFAVPVLLQLGALWQIRDALASIAEGALFTPALCRLLRRMGVLLALAAGCTLLLAPLLHSLAAQSYPRLIEFDVANLVLGAIGVSLTFLARLFERAAELQRELEEIF